jgi:ferric-dicitrate binding protein FerR (iron transport regulator)
VEDNSLYYNNLLTRYFSGETTPEEVRMLADWVKSDPGNQHEFDTCRKIWQTLQADTIMSTLDVDAEWDAFKQKNIAASTSKSVRLESGKKSGFHLPFMNRFTRIAAILLVVAVSSFIIFRIINQPSAGTIASTDVILEQTLPDGTSVTLNTGSTLDYEKFNKAERNVKLKGEAWFEVARNVEKPFIISAGDIRIKVLGTAFYVNARDLSSRLEVILTRGRVAVYYKDKPNEFVILEPGEKIEIEGEHAMITKKRNEDPNFLAWKTYRLVMDDMALADAVSLINKVYHSNIVISDSMVADCRINATFDNQPLDAVLNVLEATLGIKFIQKGNEIQINGNGCR